MTLVEVLGSSQIAAVAYENEVLIVRFNTGAVYSYSNVPKETYDNLLTAESKGHYLNAEIKPKYNCTKLTK